MSSDETPKIEPTLELKDAPSIAADEPQARGEERAGRARGGRGEIRSAGRAEAAGRRRGHAAEAPKPSQDRSAEPAARAAARATQRPRARSSKAPAPKADWTPRAAPPASRCSPPASRSRRASVRSPARSASPSSARCRPNAGRRSRSCRAKEHVADDVKALKDTRRAAARHHEVAERQSCRAQDHGREQRATQSNKIAETLDRVEKGQAEQRKATATQRHVALCRKPPARSPRSRPRSPMVLGDPPTTLQAADRAGLGAAPRL